MRRRVCDAVHQVDGGHRDVFVRFFLGLLLSLILQPLVTLRDNQSEQGLFGVCGDVLSACRMGRRWIVELLREQHRSNSALELALLSGLADKRQVWVSKGRMSAAKPWNARRRTRRRRSS